MTIAAVNRRPNARSRLYSPAWDRAAAEFKVRHPLCLGCLAIGRRERTEVVDHVQPHRGDKSRFWDARNWQASCAWHHNAIKPRLEALFERGEIEASDLLLNSRA